MPSRRQFLAYLASLTALWPFDRLRLEEVMTDTDNLDDLANAISRSSPKVRAYAQAQAAASQSQEIDIRALLDRVTALEQVEPAPEPQPEPEPGPIEGQGYSIVFSDDFDTLDYGMANKWNNGLWYPPSRGSNPVGSVSIAGSILELRSAVSLGNPEITITSMHNDDSGGERWKYGYYEARMQWSDVTGSWPGFWLLSWNHAHDLNPGGAANLCCELDVFEGYTQAFALTKYHFNGALHRTTGDGDGVLDELRFTQPNVGIDLTAAFHTYAALWTAGAVKFYLDDVQVGSTLTPFDSFEQEMFLLFDIWREPGTSVGNADRWLKVDWVRVWQR